MEWKIKAKLVLQLRAEGLSGRAIAAYQSISRNSVADVLAAPTDVWPSGTFRSWLSMANEL